MGIPTNSTEFCIACFESDTSYWCAKGLDELDGVCCNINQTVDECLGSFANQNEYICSNTQNFTHGEEHLLCPLETGRACNSPYTFPVNQTDIAQYFSTGNVNGDTV